MQEIVLEWPRSRKRAVVAGLDFCLALLATWLAFTLRLDVWHRPISVEWVVYFVAPTFATSIFARFGLYNAVFRYTGVAAIIATSKAVAIYGLILVPVILVLFALDGVPRSLCILQPSIFLVLVLGSRMLGWQWLGGRATMRPNRLLIYGAGSAGAQTSAALRSTRQYTLVGFIDDDPLKTGTSIDGIRIYGPDEVQVVTQQFAITDILLALPSAGRERRNQIIASLQSLPVRIKSLPSVGDLASGRVALEDFKDLDIEDLLGREPIATQPDLLTSFIVGKTIIVTGAGGSIGSELCRQIARAQPKKLVLIDHSEFALYVIHQELESWIRLNSIDLQLTPLLANVCNAERLEAIYSKHRPAIIYHAAAYKHVPMVEANCGEGVINNVLGTLTLATLAQKYCVERFILVSTDKAVRPTNVMGASKRVAEQILQAISAFDEISLIENSIETSISRTQTCFSMVRFGNVLGSSGSVVPLFRSQIAAGGPITVTHPDVTRYFMTVPEAVQLLLHAGAMARNGDLFVLNMGQSVKILDLAKRMIALSGLTCRDGARPTGDIEIAVTGLRPGEKLYEELLIGENPISTDHPRIIRAREDFMAWSDLQKHLLILISAARSDEVTDMKAVLNLLVPGYVNPTTNAKIKI